MLRNTPLRDTCDAMFRAALNARLGIIVRTNNAFRARKLLYSYRDEIRDPSFASIVIDISPDDAEHDLWLRRVSGTGEVPDYNSNLEEIQL